MITKKKNGFKQKKGMTKMKSEATDGKERKRRPRENGGVNSGQHESISGESNANS
jgi:hypothetical protein